jgi:hypothetical protein
MCTVGTIKESFKQTNRLILWWWETHPTKIFFSKKKFVIFNDFSTVFVVNHPHRDLNSLSLSTRVHTSWDHERIDPRERRISVHSKRLGGGTESQVKHWPKDATIV